ncbi:MAG: transporter substrate-binding domain-containing protein [Prevotella sp.]|nr:transporter substrate-binding domain-containing protein [Prevotella sp.]
MKQLFQLIGLALLALLWWPLSPASAQSASVGGSPVVRDTARAITSEHPLVYEDSWDLWPYCFLNEYGEPEGFNIDLMKLIMQELDMPYEVKLKSRREALRDLKEGRADLTLGMDAHFHNEYGFYGKSVVQLFTHSLLSPRNRAVTIRNIRDLATQRVIVHENSFSHNLMKQRGWGDNAIAYDDMKEAVQLVASKQEGQILWNTASLKWLMQMYHTDNLQLTAVDISHGEYKFMSRNSRLLARIDSAYQVVSASGRIEPIQNKWFYPDRQDTGIPSWIWYLTGFLLAALLVLAYFNVMYRSRERKMTELSRQRNNRLALVLQASHVRMWTYDIATQMFTWMDQNGLPQRQYTSIEFARRYHAEDFERLCEGLRQIAAMEKDKVTIELKATDEDAATAGEREFVITLSPLRRDHGKPTVILGTKSDVTEDREKQRVARRQLMRYQSVFNTAMVDMVYYDQQGNIADMNQRAQSTFGITVAEAVRRHMSIVSALNVPFPDLNKLEYFYATQIDMPHKAVATTSKTGYGKNTMYYELQLVPVHDRQHQLLGIYGTGRDVSEVVGTYRQAQEGIRKVQQATNEVTSYVQNINYVLGVGGVRMANYSPADHTLTIYKGLGVVQLSLTQSRCMTLVDERSKKSAMRTLNSMDNRTTNNVALDLQTTLRIKGMPLHLSFRFIPTYDKDGHVQAYFGLCRDMSEMKATEALLEKETARAQEVENLKNSFLRNMSYEIRTPLNAVVGFAELFEMDHSVDDEAIFISEIKNNSAHLLELINDILFLSRLDARMIEINRQPIDFAQTFEAHCQIGWANFQKEGVRYVAQNHYEQLVVDIDDANVGRIIEQIVINAAQHTDRGYVHTRYDYINGNLMIAIEDTGCGMSQQMLTHIFERFATSSAGGTGLGLPICKELAEQMGGTISINSEEGKGTTIWISLPCTATVIKRKNEL